MAQKTAIETFEIHLERILGDYLALAELVNDFQTLKNRKNLSTGKYIVNRDLERKVEAYQKQLAKLSYHGMQIEKELLDLQTS
jgi:cell division protein FtsB